MSPAIAKARAFLAAFKQTGSITRAADAVKMDRSLHYRWLALSSNYARDFRKASDEFADALEGEAIRRAIEGVLEPVFYQGLPCGAIRVYSDGLMQFLLKGFKPEKYAQRVSAELTGPGGGPVAIRNADLAALSNDELADLRKLALKVALAQGAGSRVDDPASAEN